MIPLGLSLVGAGLLLNEFTIARWVSVDGVLETSTRVAVWLVDVGLVLLGLVVATRKTPFDPFLPFALWTFTFVFIYGLFVTNDGLSQS